MKVILFITIIIVLFISIVGIINIIQSDKN